ncbi:hypothetical protein BDR26DRAFT_915939 [Obelidium mucronatum]|nr:hypothetical protein BDR26DRAFT_915939 [Obelidium mucronatum]
MTTASQTDKLVIDKLLSLKKPEVSGKWTVAAGIAVDGKVVAIGTGVKCLSRSAALEGRDKVVADAHAEVLCRRSFIRFLLNQIILALKGESSSLFAHNDANNSDRYPLMLKQPAPTVEMYISHSPCGDASMSCLESTQTEEERVENEAKRRKYLDGTKDAPSMPANEALLPAEFKRARERGQVLRGRDDYNALGVLRTKPGRVDSEMSISMSCSDKIAKWGVVGISGALVALFVAEPIYLSTILVGRDLFDAVGLKRALVDRVQDVQGLPGGYNGPTDLKIVKSIMEFPYSKSLLEEKAPKDSAPTPSDVCLIWTSGIAKGNGVEILNRTGRKHGHSKKGKSEWQESSESAISNNQLLKLFLNVSSISKEVSRAPSVLRDLDLTTMSLTEIKILSTDYNDAKKALFAHESFRGWGFMHLAEAKYVLGPEKVGQYSYDRRMQATAFCSSSEVERPASPSETIALDSLNLNELRNRKEPKQSKDSTAELIEDEPQPKPKIKDAIQMFSAFPPTSLRNAQSEFKRVLAKAEELAAVKMDK